MSTEHELVEKLERKVQELTKTVSLLAQNAVNGPDVKEKLAHLIEDNEKLEARVKALEKLKNIT